jgi:hypothetical protein
MTPGYGRAPPEAAQIWPTSGSISGNVRPFRCNYQQSDPKVRGRLPPEIGGIERRAHGRGEAGRFKIRFERIASVSRPRLRRLAWCARRPGANAIAVARLSWTPKKHQSGEIDYTGRISKIGDGLLRTALYDAAQIILTEPLKGCSQLKSWAM